MLAGDALHSNNPIGGLGLTGGILDAYCYGNALSRVLKDGEHDNLLTTCALARRNAWIGTTDKLSQENMRRLYSEDPKIIAGREEFFRKLNHPENGKKFGAVVGKAFDNMMIEDFSKLTL